MSLLGVAYFCTDWSNSAALESCRLIHGFQPFNASLLFGLPVTIHTLSAVIFFLAITLANVFTALNTVEIIPDRDKQRFWRNISQVFRFILPLSLGMVLLLLRGDRRLVLWLEWGGIWAFSIYWLLKCIEILSAKIGVDIVNGTYEWIETGEGRRLSRKPDNGHTMP